MSIHNRVAKLCLRHFTSIVKVSKFKQNEWTVLSCIVVEHLGNSDMSVVAFGTGSKCIGQTMMSQCGDILNDSHAEVICRRAFLRFLYCEMLNFCDNKNSLLEYSESLKKFRLKNVQFHFFTSHVPCGDAAIFPKQNMEDFGTILVKGDTFSNEEAADRNSDVTYGSKRRYEGDEDENISKKICTGDTYRTGAKCLKNDALQDTHLEGSAYHVTGAVRTKPGRGDPTLSVSCSDKLAKWSCLGVQGSLLSLLLEEPIHFKTFTVAGGTPFCKEALERALYGKTENFELKEPYSLHKVDIGQADDSFVFAKTNDKVPSPISIAWLNFKTDRQTEVSVEGKRQGVTKKKIDTESARLKICKVELFRMFLEVVKKFNVKLPSSERNLEVMNYWDVKHLAAEYQEAWVELKKAFKVWTNKDIKYNMFKAF